MDYRIFANTTLVHKYEATYKRNMHNQNTITYLQLVIRTSTGTKGLAQPKKGLTQCKVFT